MNGLSEGNAAGSELLTWERRDPLSDVLIVTNMWPDVERPVYGIHVQREVESLQRAGLRCDILYLRGYKTPLAYARAAQWFARSSTMLRDRYQLIHAHAGETGLVARFERGTPLLVTFHGDDVMGNPSARGGLTLQSRLRAFVIRHHSRTHSATVTVSAEMESVLPARVRARNYVLPLGINTELFKPIEKAEARRRLGWDPDGYIALFGATKPWIPRKRHALAAAACEQAARKLKRPVELYVADGVPPDLMPVLMSAADCLLITSSIEGSPCIVKESLMSGLPVVATPAGDIELLLRDVEPSYVCAPDETELGKAVASCITTRARSNGRQAASWLTDEAAAQRLLAVYRSLAPVEVPAPEPAVSSAGVVVSQ